MSAGQSRPTIPLWLGGLFLITFMSMMFAAGLEIQGLYRAHQERIQLQEWPAVTARVMHCYLDQYYPFQRDGGGVIYLVHCRFSYSVAGSEFTSTVDVPGEHHNIRHPAQLPDDALHMKSWAARRPKGSFQVIHYDPANPESISLAGAADEIRSNTSAISLTAARQAICLGLGLLLTAILALQTVRKRKLMALMDQSGGATRESTR